MVVRVAKPRKNFFENIRTDCVHYAVVKPGDYARSRRRKGFRKTLKKTRFIVKISNALRIDIFFIRWTFIGSRGFTANSDTNFIML